MDSASFGAIVGNLDARFPGARKHITAHMAKGGALRQRVATLERRLARGGRIKRAAEMSDTELLDFLRTNSTYAPFYEEFVAKFGEPPDVTPSGSRYDYRAAIDGGVVPVRDPHDRLLHWSGQLPDGSYLKAPNHPTMWKSRFMDATGQNPDDIGVTEDMAQGRAYASGGTVDPNLGNPYIVNSHAYNPYSYDPNARATGASYVMPYGYRYPSAGGNAGGTSSATNTGNGVVNGTELPTGAPVDSSWNPATDEANMNDVARAEMAFTTGPYGTASQKIVPMAVGNLGYGYATNTGLFAPGAAFGGEAAATVPGGLSAGVAGESSTALASGAGAGFSSFLGPVGIAMATQSALDSLSKKSSAAYHDPYNHPQTSVNYDPTTGYSVGTNSRPDSPIGAQMYENANAAIPGLEALRRTYAGNLNITPGGSMPGAGNYMGGTGAIFTATPETYVGSNAAANKIGFQDMLRTLGDQSGYDTGRLAEGYRAAIAPIYGPGSGGGMDDQQGQGLLLSGDPMAFGNFYRDNNLVNPAAPSEEQTQREAAERANSSFNTGSSNFGMAKAGGRVKRPKRMASGGVVEAMDARFPGFGAHFEKAA